METSSCWCRAVCRGRLWYVGCNRVEYLEPGLVFGFNPKPVVRRPTKGGIPMKKHSLTVVAAACALLVIALASAARAADQAPAEKKMPAKNGLAEDLMKVSNDGYHAVRAIHVARIAIFNGNTKLADELLEKAKKDLDAATKDAATFAATRKPKIMARREMKRVPATRWI